ncbi:MAG: hypothetical protein R3F59_14925 [Myxococcota bacterium]
MKRLLVLGPLCGCGPKAAIVEEGPWQVTASVGDIGIVASTVPESGVWYEVTDPAASFAYMGDPKAPGGHLDSWHASVLPTFDGYFSDCNGACRQVRLRSITGREAKEISLQTVPDDVKDAAAWHMSGHYRIQAQRKDDTTSGDYYVADHEKGGRFRYEVFCPPRFGWPSRSDGTIWTLTWSDAEQWPSSGRTAKARAQCPARDGKPKQAGELFELDLEPSKSP